LAEGRKLPFQQLLGQRFADEILMMAFRLVTKVPPLSVCTKKKLLNKDNMPLIII
jgi:hypothetical protein